jgi:hypothetical protein
MPILVLYASSGTVGLFWCCMLLLVLYASSGAVCLFWTCMLLLVYFMPLLVLYSSSGTVCLFSYEILVLLCENKQCIHNLFWAHESNNINRVVSYSYRFAVQILHFKIHTFITEISRNVGAISYCEMSLYAQVPIVSVMCWFCKLKKTFMPNIILICYTIKSFIIY